MKTTENIKKVALVFFIVLGGAHLVSGLMVSVNYFVPVSTIANRVLDIPFAMSALLYGLTGISTKMNEKSRKIGNIVSIALSLLIFGVLIYINLLIPDKGIV